MTNWLHNTAGGMFIVLIGLAIGWLAFVVIVGGFWMGVRDGYVGIRVGRWVYLFHAPTKYGRFSNGSRWRSGLTRTTRP